MTSSLDLAYNTDLEKLTIPEYGRNIQKMIEHAKKIEDKEERNKSAKVIIKVMDLINPGNKSNGTTEEHQQKLWAHLHIISNFNLDIDSPYELPSKEDYQSRPEKVPYPSNAIKYGHYGKIMEDMVKAATNFKEGEEKQSIREKREETISKDSSASSSSTIGDEYEKMMGGEDEGTQEVDLPPDSSTSSLKDENEGQTLTDKINQPIFPSFIQVVDDPTLQQFQNIDLNGYYHIDDDGVISKPVNVVENGVLKNFLIFLYLSILFSIKLSSLSAWSDNLTPSS